MSDGPMLEIENDRQCVLIDMREVITMSINIGEEERTGLRILYKHHDTQIFFSTKSYEMAAAAFNKYRAFKEK